MRVATFLRGYRGLTGLLVAGLLAGLQVVTAPPAGAAPTAPIFGPAIDPYQLYDGQDMCDPTAKPGVRDFRDLLARTYGRADWGITRACGIGGRSEHKEGRALDYPFDATNSAELAQARDLLDWLLATDRYGNEHALARRLGIMYIIWDYQIWRPYSNPPSWRPRACDGTPTDCHTNHIHFSFSRAGAWQQTTWWAGRGAAVTPIPPPLSRVR
jgi:hypothetical protein